ncbi:MAG: hypothetical protein BMS9Abin11_1807 [Gammaproteobacteria bacterium]|nr:MAG: hypothetical protein BMS9Abin11_1807 [Gammaproteobacteria bacterium]
MAVTIPKVVPESFVIGDTLKFTQYFSEFQPGDSWVLSYALVNAAKRITFTSSDNGDGSHLVNVDEATTLLYTIGIYRYQARVTNGTDVFTVDTGTIELRTDFATAAVGYDDRSHVKKTLDALEATILGKASKDQLSYSIANRSISLMSPAELTEWRNTYRSEYRIEQQAEDAASGKATGNKILSRF